MSLNISSLFSVQGIVAVITGVGSGGLHPLSSGPSNKIGLGRSIALALDANHASKVFILGCREHILLETCAQARNHTLIPVPMDVSSKGSLEEAYHTIAAQTNHIDLLIVNSGILGPPSCLPLNTNPSLSEFRDHHFSHPMDSFNRVFEVNITASHYTILAFLPLLENANRSRPIPEENTPSPPVRKSSLPARSARYSAVQQGSRTACLKPLFYT